MSSSSRCSVAAAQADALEIAGKGARVEFFGGLPKTKPTAELSNTNHLHYKELARFRFVFREKMTDFQAAYRADPKRALSRREESSPTRCRSTASPTRFHLMETGEALKVCILPRNKPHEFHRLRNRADRLVDRRRRAARRRATGAGRSNHRRPGTWSAPSRRRRRATTDRAVESAQKASLSWSKLSVYERDKIIRKATNHVRGKADEIGRLMALEQGKPFNQSEARSHGVLRHHRLLRGGGPAHRGAVLSHRGQKFAPMGDLPAGRRLRPHHALELSGLAPELEARARPRGRLHRGGQADARHADVSDRILRGARRGRHTRAASSQRHQQRVGRPRRGTGDVIRWWPRSP
jgi:hypothetical protein